MSDKEIDELIKELNEKDISISTFKYELETWKKMVDERNKEVNEENLRCSLYAVENNDLKEKLETYKKIAEFLAGGLKFWSNSKMSEKELIDWARKEVENGS